MGAHDRLNLSQMRRCRIRLHGHQDGTRAFQFDGAQGASGVGTMNCNICGKIIDNPRTAGQKACSETCRRAYAKIYAASYRNSHKESYKFGNRPSNRFHSEPERADAPSCERGLSQAEPLSSLGIAPVLKYNSLDNRLVNG